MSISNPSWTDVPPAGRLLRPAEVIAITGLSRSLIYQMIAEKRFPPFIKLSKRASALPQSWLEAFVENQARVALS
jgi:prophage regulatory protein